MTKGALDMLHVMQEDAVDRVGFRDHESVECHGSVGLIYGKHVNGYPLGEDMDGIVTAAMELVVVILVN